MYNFDFSLEGEIWKDVVGHEGLYLVSNKGRVINLKKKDSPYVMSTKNSERYERVNLSKNKIVKKPCVHQIVMRAFVGVSDMDIDHINGERKDNRLENLEYVSHRENTSRYYKKIETSSKYIGVYKTDNKYKVWQSAIFANKKTVYLGAYFTEEEAACAYKIALNRHQNNLPISRLIVKELVSTATTQTKSYVILRGF